MIPGHRNFFGGKVGQTLLNAAKALSPLEIHSGAGARVLGSVERGSAAAASMDAFNAVVDRTMTTNRGAWKAMKGMPGGTPPLSDLVKKYFQGYTVPEMAMERGVPSAMLKTIGLSSSIDMGQRKFRQKVRIGVFAGLGTMAGSEFFFGSGNPISSTLGFGVRAAGHTAVGLGAMQFHPLAGTAYLGATALNTFRPGDNMGPM